MNPTIIAAAYIATLEDRATPAQRELALRLTHWERQLILEGWKIGSDWAADRAWAIMRGERPQKVKATE